jgi:hypothetical protein
MIHKQYKPDGSPDLRAWVVECDVCAIQHTLTGTNEWCIPEFTSMPDYCPFCTNVIAAYLIETAFT